MAKEQDAVSTVAATKDLAGILDVDGFVDNCSCTQSANDSALLEDPGYQNILMSFDPEEVKSIAELLRLAGPAKAQTK